MILDFWFGEELAAPFLGWRWGSGELKFAVRSKGLLDHFDWRVRQGFQEEVSVALGEDAVVEDADEAAVFRGADEAADALAEFQDGLGDAVFHEGISAGGFDGFES